MAEDKLRVHVYDREGGDLNEKVFSFLDENGKSVEGLSLPYQLELSVLPREGGGDTRITTGVCSYVLRGNLFAWVEEFGWFRHENKRYHRTKEGLFITLYSNDIPVREFAEQIKAISPERIHIHKF